MNIKLIVAWLFVGLPLAWGVVRSVQQSLPLFGSVKTEVKVK